MVDFTSTVQHYNSRLLFKLSYFTKLQFAFLQLASGSFLSDSPDNAKIQLRLVKDADTRLIHAQIDRCSFCTWLFNVMTFNIFKAAGAPSVPAPAVQYLLVVGGSPKYSLVEVVSLDPETNPVPNCLVELNSFPTTVEGGAGAMLGEGNLRNKSLPYFGTCLLKLVRRCDLV
jgi:hypothetical protein